MKLNYHGGRKGIPRGKAIKDPSKGSRLCEKNSTRPRKARIQIVLDLKAGRIRKSRGSVRGQSPGRKGKKKGNTSLDPMSLSRIKNPGSPKILKTKLLSCPGKAELRSRK